MIGLTTGIMVFFTVANPFGSTLATSMATTSTASIISTVSIVEATTPETSTGVTTPITLETYVRNYFADVPVLAEVARCESTFRQFGKDGKVMRGNVDPRDVGVMQINEFYQGPSAKKAGYDIYTLEGNMAYAKLIYQKQGTQPWSASRPCWGAKDVAMK